MSVQELVPIRKVERPVEGRKKSFRRAKVVKKIGWWNSWCESKERKEERERERGRDQGGKKKKRKERTFGLKKETEQDSNAEDEWGQWRGRQMRTNRKSTDV